MLLKLKGGTVYDPAHGVNGEVRDLYVRDGRIVADPGPDERIDREYDVARLHRDGGRHRPAHPHRRRQGEHRPRHAARGPPRRSGAPHRRHARLLRPRRARARSPTGYRYAEMGYTACFEPAMLPINARQAHMEMGDTPIVDKGAYAMLGSDDFLLRLLAAGAEQALINDYVAWTLHATPGASASRW